MFSAILGFYLAVTFQFQFPPRYSFLLQGRADWFELPGTTRTFDGPEMRYRLELSNNDGWRSSHCLASLRERTWPGRLLWRKPLPQRFGPRFAIVTADGSVVTLDEWEQTASPFAVVVINGKGHTVNRYATQEIFNALGSDPRKVVALAKPGLGLWISGLPQLERDMTTVSVEAGGGKLYVNGLDGRIRFTNERTTALCKRASTHLSPEPDPPNHSLAQPPDPPPVSRP